MSSGRGPDPSEEQPLLRKPSTNGSVRFDESTRDGSEISRNGPRPAMLTSSSSLSMVFQRLTKSQRGEALKKEGVGAATFLIRDAVLGDASPSAGTFVESKK